MKIECKTTFLDGRDRYVQGDVREVPDADAERFVAAGWAVASSSSAHAATPGASSVDLDIHNSTLGVTSLNRS